jgi:aspartyl-tRNA(Asn)/glutamyl-tRNA(Gln) amidotransferase subunit A
MLNKDILRLSISELAPKIKSREISPVELTQAALEQLDRVKPEINSFITILAEAALKQAKAAEKSIIKGGYLGPLHGIPIGIKDNLATKNIRTTIGSKIFTDYVPDEDAFAVKRVKEAGAVILGKENMHEFAMGATSNNPHYGAVHNPWSLDSIPGGSSGGSAANVASCVTYGSLGTDAGGSVRMPASFCGVVGIKPTYGRVSQRGLLSSVFGNDHIGPLTRTVRDNALILQVIAGYDPLDPTTVPVPVPDYTAGLNGSVKRLKMGIPRNYFFDPIDPEVDKAVRNAIDTLQEMGIKSTEVSLPSLEYAPALRIISSVENLVAHEDIIRKHKKEYGEDVLFRMLPAQFVRAVDFARCMRVQRLIIDDFLKVLRDVDFLAVPTTPAPAYPIDAETITIAGITYPVKGAGRSSSIIGRNTFIGNHLGLPCLSVPCGLSRKGLPIGLQLIGRAFDEGLLYRVAHHYEESFPLKGRYPKIAM